MNQGKFVFSQITSFLPQRIFDRIVSNYEGNYKIRHFTCWNQMLCMIFGQLSNRDSLSDLVLTINAHSKKFYHLGFGKSVSKTNLARANEQRDFMIYQEFAYHIINEARHICLPDKNIFAFDNPVFAFDSSTVDLCLNAFCWATFRQHKGAIKLHTLFDIRTSIPVFVEVTPGTTHDVNLMDSISYEQGGYYIFDRGYLDFKRLFLIHQLDAFFVIRSRNNLQFKRKSSRAVNKSTGVKSDQNGSLTVFYSKKGYPELLRQIKFFDKEQERTFIFLTNNMDLKAEDIAMLYKNRWKIELFFKWIKQHLKIKTFWGRSENAVKTQVYIAVISFTVIAIIKQKLNSEYSNYEILQILGASLLDKTDINQLITKDNTRHNIDQSDNQLKIF